MYACQYNALHRQELKKVTEKVNKIPFESCRHLHDEDNKMCTQ